MNIKIIKCASNTKYATSDVDILCFVSKCAMFKRHIVKRTYKALADPGGGAHPARAPLTAADL